MNRRTSGILVHITSLPSRYGIGDFGPEAYRFADFLEKTRQGCWQILPLNPTSIRYGNSPYSSYSAFAGNPLLISPDLLVKDRLLTEPDLRRPPSFPKLWVDYKAVTEYKYALLRRAYQRNLGRIQADDRFRQFCQEQSKWLDDYALFVALKVHFQEKIWSDWPPEIRDRRPKVIRIWREKLRDHVLMEKFIQYLFYKQWAALKEYCNDRQIQIVGDLPIYVHFQSADVWSHPDLFKLDSRKRPTVVAGIPPDYFSATGQLWGNPIYRWDELKKQKYRWWLDRMSHNLKLFDFIRLDHFKGFVDYWEVPATEKNAIKGVWVKVPGEDFFRTLLKNFSHLPIIAEDLGIITAEVRALREQFGLPGMRVLQFAFGNDPLADFYKPVHYIPNCVAYTGTHDNDTFLSWLYGKSDYSTRKPAEIKWERENALRYIGRPGSMRKTKEVRWEFFRLLLMSVANLVIIPMQDILGLENEGRMNKPATADGNWEWRYAAKQVTPSITKNLSDLTERYQRV